MPEVRIVRMVVRVCDCKLSDQKSHVFSDVTKGQQRFELLFKINLDVNECQLSNFYCGEKGVCKNLVGSYECECADGFQRDQYTGQCVDIDECK